MSERRGGRATRPGPPSRTALALENLWSGWRSAGGRHSHGNTAGRFDFAFPVQQHWGAPVAFYLYLGGTAGGFVFLEVLLRWFGLIGAGTAAAGMWIGLALSLLSILAIFDHLGPVARWRFYLAFLRPRTSWISRGVLIVTTLVLLRLLVALPTVPGAEGLPWAEGTAPGSVLRLLVLAFALAFMLYSGLVISSWNAIAFWNSPLLPVLFTSFSFLGGLAALPAVAWLVEGLPAMAALGLVWPSVLALLAANGLLLALYLQGMSTASRPARVSVRMLTRGALRPRFLGGVVLLGLLLPAAVIALRPLGLLGSDAGSAAILVAAVAAIEVGGYFLRDAVLRVGVYGPPV